MPNHQSPDEAADEMLAGGDLPGGTDQAVVAAAAVLRQAASPATDNELANADATIARFVEVVRAETIPQVLPRSVRRLPISAKAAAILAAATLWSTGVAAAATGNLPGGLQRAVSETADRVGLELPRPKADKATDGRNAEDGPNETAAATTTSIASTSSSISTTSGSSTTVAATTVAATPTVAAVSSGSTVASRGVGPDVNGPAQDGLCNAYLKSLANGHPKNPEAPPWRNLLAAAKEAGQSVEAFCNGEATTSTTVASAASSASTTATTVSAAPTAATPTTTTTVSAAGTGNGNGGGNGGGNGNGNSNGNSGGGNSGQGNGGGNGNGNA